MSETLVTPDFPADTPSKSFSWVKLLLTVVPYVALYVVAVWLVAMTDSSPDQAGKLWLWFVPVVGLIAIYGGWHRMSVSGDSLPGYLIKQILHWGATAGVLHILFWPTVLVYLNAETHGFVDIYILGLSAILAGVYVDWKMGLFGLFLVGSGVGIAFLDDNAMLMTLTGFAVLAVGLSVLILRLRKA